MQVISRGTLSGMSIFRPSLTNRREKVARDVNVGAYVIRPENRQFFLHRNTKVTKQHNVFYQISTIDHDNSD